MKEIKFRAWDDELKQLIYSDERDKESREVEYWFDIEVGKIVCKWLECCDDSMGYPAEHSGSLDNIMQYTGLKDKNGIEIYEGDIVKFTNMIDEIFNEEIGVCVFAQDECNFCLQRTIKNSDNYPVPTTINTIYLISNVTFADDVSYEVIGDIYRNPELLEEE